MQQHISKSAEWTEYVSGCYKFLVLRFSMLKKLSVGTCIASETFEVGGHKWVLEFYPAGQDEASKDYVGCYLRLVRPTCVVKAMFELAINYPDGSYSTDTGSNMYMPYTFSKDLPCCGSPQFTEREYIDANAVKHDSFYIRCAMWVRREVE